VSTEIENLVRTFVDVYNAPGSDVYPLFADDVDWSEHSSGRGGGREELFSALRELRAEWTELHLEIDQIIADEDSAALVSSWTARMPDGAQVATSIVWILEFKDGLITKEHDYVLLKR
jgi:ketosteroid isomerase-like protein